MSEPLINISRTQALCFAGALVFFEFLTYISNDMIMPAMLAVTNTFHAPDTSVANSLTAYILGGASLQLFLGPLADNMGRKPVMIAGVILFLSFTILLGLSQSMPQFLIGRFIQGMGLCFIMIGYTTIQELFSEMDAVRLIAILANTAIIAPLLGPLAGALFITHFHWRNIYLLVAVCTLFSLYSLKRTMPETLGAERRDGKPIARIPFKIHTIAQNYSALIHNLPFMLGVIALGLLVSPCIAWIGLAPLILISQAKLSVIQYALWQIPLFGACIFGNFFLHWLTYYYPLVRIIQIGSAISIFGLILMYAMPYLFNTTYLFFIPGLTIYGFGLGTTSGPLTRYLLFITPVSKGTTNAFISTLELALIAVCSEVANLLYESQNNLYFGGCVAGFGLLYLLFISLCLGNTPKVTDGLQKQ